LAAQQPRIKRIPLLKYDVPGTELETVVGIAEIAPNVLPKSTRCCTGSSVSVA
jgi:hypothetical protein